MTINILHACSVPDEESLRRAAADVFGSVAVAEAWFEQQAMALGHRRPMDLMGTAPGRELVRTVLGRIDFGVYT